MMIALFKTANVVYLLIVTIIFLTFIQSSVAAAPPYSHYDTTEN